ncbi:MAG: DNA primase [bacterium]|nr:DNA primase [bacterium]
MTELEEIKSKINIIDFINDYVPLKRTGRNFRAPCPFHSEKTPSFIVSPERQIWHCFGSCGEGGDIFRFLMKWENLEFPEALRILAKRAGVRLREYTPGDAGKLREKIYEINHLASEFYHYLLLNHPSGKRALDYVLGRGITKKSIEQFKIGWAPNLWDGASRFLIKKKGYALPEVDRAGLLVKGERGYYDRFRGRLMFTLKNHRGDVVGFAGRVLEPQPKEAKYINTPETPVYVKGEVLYGLDLTREAIKKENLAILVEGEVDLIQAYQAGTRNIVAIKGSALTESQVNLLKRYTETIALALDTDLAGDAAARRGIEIADRAGLNIRVIKLEAGKDPDECLRQDPRNWFAALKKAVPFFDFLIDSAFARFDTSTAEGKKKIAAELLSVLANISNEIVKNHYVKKLAKRLEVSEEAIDAAMAKSGRKEEVRGFEKGWAKKVSREEILEEYLLSLLLQSADPRSDLGSVLAVSDSEKPETFFTSPGFKKIFLALKEFLASLDGEFKISDFVRDQPQELMATIDRLYLKDWGKIVENEVNFQQEILKITQEIKVLALKRDLRSLAEKIKQTQDEAAMTGLSRQFKTTSEKLKALNLAVSPAKV